jgi:prolipoprotein diacylglyceryltransferase
MWKLLVLAVFSLGVCWVVSMWINIGQTAFNIGPVAVSWTMLLFSTGLVVGYKLIKK